MSRLLQNVVFAWRLVRRQPAFSAIAILTLALGIGATTALRSDVAAVDPLLPLANVKPLETLVDASIAARRFTMMLSRSLQLPRRLRRLASTASSRIWSVNAPRKLDCGWRLAPHHPP